MFIGIKCQSGGQASCQQITMIPETKCSQVHETGESGMDNIPVVVSLVAVFVIARDLALAKAGAFSESTPDWRDMAEVIALEYSISLSTACWVGKDGI